MRRIPLLAAALLLPAAAPLPPVPIFTQFGRWQVTCDNTRACVARGFDEGTQAQLDLIRPSGNAGPTLTLSATDALNAATLRLDGKPLPLPAPAWSKTADTISTSDPAAVDAFVAAARDAHAITLDAASSADDIPRTIPLDGFTAALLRVDAVQGRPGTGTALVAARGAAAAPPAPQVPAAPSWTIPPRLNAAERVDLVRRAGHLASPRFDPCEVRAPPAVFALDAVNALAIRPCYLAAYQGSSVVAVLPRAAAPTGR